MCDGLLNTRLEVSCLLPAAPADTRPKVHRTVRCLSEREREQPSGSQEFPKLPRPGPHPTTKSCSARGGRLAQAAPSCVRSESSRRQKGKHHSCRQLCVRFTGHYRVFRKFWVNARRIEITIRSNCGSFRSRTSQCSRVERFTFDFRSVQRLLRRRRARTNSPSRVSAVSNSQTSSPSSSRPVALAPRRKPSSAGGGFVSASLPVIRLVSAR